MPFFDEEIEEQPRIKIVVRVTTMKVANGFVLNMEYSFEFWNGF